MKLAKLIYAIYRIGFLSPMTLFQLLAAFYRCGVNIMALLYLAEKIKGGKVALVDDKETLTYHRLAKESHELAIAFYEKLQLRSGQKVGVLCRNHASLVKAIFAVSRLGADVYLLNSEISQEQFAGFVEQHNFDVLIYDLEKSNVVEKSNYSKKKVLSYHRHLPSIDNCLQHKKNHNQPLPRASKSRIVLQTSGTTGRSKEAAHKPSLFNYLNPFLTLLNRLNLLDYQTAYIATPIYHGYGIAILLLFVVLGKKAVITNQFDAQNACDIIREHDVEVVTVVPVMLQKMLKHNPEKLRTLRCIASGGAKLPAKLVEETFLQLGSVLYNLYGTSEAGLNIVATPQDLAYSTTTLGRKITGVKLKVLDKEMKEVSAGTVGQFCFKNDWSMNNRMSSWIETGDLGYQDNNGYYYLCGRTDDMVVSGGENVYPIEVEHVLMKHPAIEDVAVIGIDDDQFGQRLKAFVLLVDNVDVSQEELMQWLRPQVARFQQPKELTFVDVMPYTPLGKVDKKQIRGWSNRAQERVTT